MSNFADRLAETTAKKQSQVCVGLDPRLDKIPPHLVDKYREQPRSGCGCGRHEIGECFYEFGSAIIEAVAPHAIAVKFQLACFEQYGPPGLKAFRHLCDLASSAGLIVIADAKRGDIGISAAAYSAAYIGRPQGFDGPIGNLGADAMTVNPLFGSDGMQPFLDDCRDYDAGIFVLAKTSNPGSAELQDLEVMATRTGAASLKIHQKIAGLIDRWGADLIGESGYSSVGAVIGATHPDELAGLRRLLPYTPLLIPGYGAQGGAAADVAPAFDAGGLGALVTASRSIIYAGSGDDFAARAADAAGRMRSELWTAFRENN